MLCNDNCIHLFQLRLTETHLILLSANKKQLHLTGIRPGMGFVLFCNADWQTSDAGFQNNIETGIFKNESYRQYNFNKRIKLFL